MGALHARGPRHLMGTTLSITLNEVATHGQSCHAIVVEARSLAGRRSIITRNFDIGHDTI